MTKRVCSFTKPNGERCGATPISESDLCFWHHPDYQQEAAEARRLGGLRRRREGAVSGAYGLGGIKTVEDIQRVLEIAIIDTISLDNSPSRNRTLGALVASALKALEVGDLEERLTALEAALGPRELKRAGRR